jgi:hypothetical protein
MLISSSKHRTLAAQASHVVASPAAEGGGVAALVMSFWDIDICLAYSDLVTAFVQV